MIDPHHIWNVIYNAESNKHQPATSPNTAPATQNESHDWSASPMKRHLQCGEQQASTSNLTKYCACHAKWISWLIRITYATSFTMRGATSINLQPHQILRLPRKMNLMIDPHHIWSVIYNARSNRHHPPTSPNTAPATQNEHPRSDRNLLKTDQTSFPMRDRCEHDPRMIRDRSDPENAKLNPPRRQGYFSHSPGADSIENYNVSRSGYHSKFHHMRRQRKVTHELHKCCACHEKWHMNSTKCCACHEKWHMNFTKCCACHEKWHEVTHDYYCYYYYYYYYDDVVVVVVVVGSSR